MENNNSCENIGKQEVFLLLMHILCKIRRISGFAATDH